MAARPAAGDGSFRQFQRSRFEWNGVNRDRPGRGDVERAVEVVTLQEEAHRTDEVVPVYPRDVLPASVHRTAEPETRHPGHVVEDAAAVRRHDHRGAQGRAAWRRFNEAIAGGRPPARETLDGALVLFGGALLLAPGFLTDLLGIALLLPPTRALVRAVLVRRFAARMVASVATPRRFPGQPYDVDGTAVDVEPDGLDRGRR